MNNFAGRIAAVALAAVAALAPVATPALAEDFAVAGAPGLVHVVDATGDARCEATVVAPKAVLTSADCVTDPDGRIASSRDLQVVEGDMATPVSIVWTHADADADLALITVKDALESEPVALNTFSLNAKHPALTANTDWVKGIIAALEAEEAITVPAEPEVATDAPGFIDAPATTAPTAVNPIRHFMRVER